MYKSPFLNEIANFMQVRQYSRRTVSTYILWIRAYIRFNDNKHPENLGSTEIERFLTHLAVNRTVSMSTQAIALNAIVFLYTKFLQKPLTNYVFLSRHLGIISHREFTWQYLACLW